MSFYDWDAGCPSRDGKLPEDHAHPQGHRERPCGSGRYSKGTGYRHMSRRFCLLKRSCPELRRCPPSEERTSRIIDGEENAVNDVRASARRTHGDLVQAVRHTRVAAGDLALWPIGGAGYIVKSAATLIMIDPFTGPSNPPRWIRAIPPAFDPTHLAGVDAVVLTHEHDDHTDPTTLTVLLAHTQALVIGSAACVAIARSVGYPPERCRVLKHEQALAVKDVRLTAVAMHDPGAQDCNGYVVETPGVAILHCGDNLYFDGFRALARRWTLDAILVSVGVSPPGETLYMDEADAA